MATAYNQLCLCHSYLVALLFTLSATHCQARLACMDMIHVRKIVCIVYSEYQQAMPVVGNDKLIHMYSDYVFAVGQTSLVAIM